MPLCQARSRRQVAAGTPRERTVWTTPSAVSTGGREVLGAGGALGRSTSTHRTRRDRCTTFPPRWKEGALPLPPSRPRRHAGRGRFLRCPVSWTRGWLEERGEARAVLGLPWPWDGRRALPPSSMPAYRRGGSRVSPLLPPSLRRRGRTTIGRLGRG
jgi:hypothetical protein